MLSARKLELGDKARADQEFRLIVAFGDVHLHHAFHRYQGVVGLRGAIGSDRCASQYLMLSRKGYCRWLFAQYAD